MFMDSGISRAVGIMMDHDIYCSTYLSFRLRSVARAVEEQDLG